MMLVWDFWKEKGKEGFGKRSLGLLCISDNVLSRQMEHSWAKTACWKSPALDSNGPPVVCPSSSVIGWEQQEEEWPQHEHCGESKAGQLEASVSLTSAIYGVHTMAHKILIFNL